MAVVVTVVLLTATN